MAVDFSRLTVVELRQELKRRNLPQTGKKADLVDRLVAFENEQAAQEPLGDGAQSYDTPEPAASASQHPIVEGNAEGDLAGTAANNSVPPAAASNIPPDPNSVAETRQDEVADSANVEPAATATEIVNDAVSRKRRSRSPPPLEHESSTKRARPNDQIGSDSVPAYDEAVSSHEAPITKDTSPEPIQQDYPEAPQDYGKVIDGADAGTNQEEQPTYNQESDQGKDHDIPQPTFQNREDEIVDEPANEPAREATTGYDRDVPPSQHPATSALYIKNFMRPLRESMLRDYLIELAAAPGADLDPDCLVDFHLDQVRTHAFVQFTSVSSASRVRTALHGTVWPNERNRKELWVDFIPSNKVAEWADREQSEGGRGSSSRWEVRYEPDEDGNILATLVNAEAEPVRRNSRQAPGPPPVPTGPARSNYPTVEGAPSGPRGRGGNHYRQPPPPMGDSGGERMVTRANPPLQYRPVPEELAQRRLANMLSYYTKDRHRDLGREDEINRYTFENGDAFVDRGKEVFIGIRPPHRERERRRLGLGRNNRPGAPKPPSPPRRDRDEGRRYDRDRRDDRDRDRRDYRRERDLVPRSRFDGQPLPTYNGPRGGGRRGGGGGRRDRY
jgi:SAP domain-containing ribonucleoprotein